MSSVANQDPSDDPTIRGALARIGLTSESAGTLVITSCKDTNFTSEIVWDAWGKIEQWQRWGKPMIVGARWLEGRNWEVGAQFELIRSLGVPIGRQVTVETVREVNAGQSVAWWDGKGGSVRTCTIWFFERLDDGTTRVHSTLVFVGWLVALFKWLMKGNLRRANDAKVEGLIKMIEREHLSHA